MTLKVAVVGAGHMGRYHAQKFARCEGAELVGVLDADRARAEAVAREVGCPVLSELPKDAAAAVVSVPTDRHHTVALECLRRGLHVLVEKPIATTLAEADELIAAAKESGAVLMVGHVERYNRAFQALCERMQRPVFVEAERLAGFKQRGAEVDVVLDLMIHDLDLASALARSEICAITACGFRVLTSEIDIANARIEFANGCVANLSASRVSQAPVRKLRVFEPGQYVSADLHEARLRYVRQADGRIEQNEERHAGGDALAVQAAAFVAAASGRTEVQSTGEEGRRSLELALEIGRLVRERLERFR
ncbi:MAG: Gfo/Idh/MocA family protein [Betaproteobacteria bacterium]